MVNDHDLEKYSRQIILNEIGHEGQEKIKRVSILVIGAGGLGSSVIQYLSAAGVGKIGIVDDDKVELSNLNRQLIYAENDLGESKVDAAKNYISKSNPSIEIETFKIRIDEKNLPDIIDDYDFIADCSDNIETTKQQLSSKGYELSGLALGEGFDEDAGKKRTWESLFLPNEITRGLFSFAIEHKTGKLDLLDRFTSDCVHKLDHVVINTNDAEGFIQVYEKDLGIRLALDQTVEKWGGRMLFFRLNQTTIEVIARPDEGISKDSLWGLAWDVEDLEATHTRLTKLGIEASDVKEGRKPNTLVSTIKSNTCNIPTLFIQHLDS